MMSLIDLGEWTVDDNGLGWSIESLRRPKGKTDGQTMARVVKKVNNSMKKNKIWSKQYANLFSMI